jgi:hypothetical protein
MCCNIKFAPVSLSGKCDTSRANVKKSVIFKKQIIIITTNIKDWTL